MANRMNIVQEFWLFLRVHKTYWIVPIVVVLLLLAGLVALGTLGGGAAGPFIYPLF